MISPDLAETVKRLRELLPKATPCGVTGDWYVVEPTYLPRDTNTYVIAGSPDPHVGEMVCDFADASTAGVEDHYDDDEWTARNWALAEYIAAVDPTTISSILDALEGLEREAANLLGNCKTAVDSATEYARKYGAAEARIVSLESSLAEARKGARTNDGLGVWRCFHCAEVFTDYAAAEEHFGHSLNETVACKLSDTEHGLIALYRDSRKQLDEYHNEDNEAYREFYRLGAAHTTALREAEQKGYDAGLADGRAQHPTAPQETADV